MVRTKFSKFLFFYVALGALLVLLPIFDSSFSLPTLLIMMYAAIPFFLNVIIGLIYGEMAIKGGVVNKTESPFFFKFILIFNILAVSLILLVGLNMTTPI